MTKKELEKLKDFKVYTFEWDVYVKAEDYKEIAIENKKLKENSLLWQATMEELNNRVAELEEENETLKDNVEFLHSCLDDRDKSIAIMQEEIKNLNEENDRLKNNAMEDMRVQTKLEEEIKILKEENEKLKYNNKLYKEMIDKIQIAYIKFEEATDEKYKAFRKAYWDLDQVIMNR